MDSISPGLMDDKGLSRGPRVPPALRSPPSLLTSIPSITYSGSLPALIELVPRIRIDVSAPGLPEFWVTCTPAALPCSAWSREVTGTAFSSSALTDATEPVRSLFLAVPYPITTTVESSAGFSVRRISNTLIPSSAISLVTYPE